MKFSSFLLKNMVPEWIKLYLSYKLLKNYLSNCSKVRKKLRKIKVSSCCRTYQKIKQDLLKDENVRQLLSEDNQLFVNQLKQEMQKIETFLFFKYQDLQTKMKRIAQQLKIMKYLRELSEIGNVSEMNNKLSYNSQILKETCFHLFIELQQYQSYIYFNYTGIIKILKKYRKFMLKPIIDLQMKQQQDQFTQIASTLNYLEQFPGIVNRMSTTIEKLLTSHFYPLNPEKCRYNLRKYSQKKTVKSVLYFKFGFFIGFTLVMVTLILYFRYEGYIDPDSPEIPNVFSKVFPCFRGIALFFVYYWFIGLDLWGWNSYRINYRTYLGFNHHFSTVGEVFRRTSYLSFIFLVVFLLYILQVEDLGIFRYQTEFNWGIQFLPTQYLPLIVWGIAGFYVFVPTFQYLNGAGRLWMYKMMYGATIGHFFKYESRFTFFLDQFTSMGVPMRDLDYTICYYYTLITTNQEHSGECYYQKRISSALVIIIPYTIKCIHYLTRARDKGKFWWTDEMWNFFKTILIVIVGVLSFLQKQFSVFRYIWIPVALSCSCIQYWWDLNKDWLFFEKGTRVKFLRNDLGYDKPYIYYLIAVLNLFLRLTWVLSISPDMYLHLGIKNQELFIFCVGLLEMSRRLINNFIKIEKEYITNLRSLKTTGDFKYPFDEKYLDDELFKFTRHSNSIQEEDSLSFCSGLKEKEERMSISYINSNKYEALMSVEVDEKILLMAKKEEKFQISKIKALKANRQTFQNLLDQHNP